MAYTPNIPMGPDRFRDSQPLILGNFIDINAAQNRNHVDFNMGTESGKHKFLQMPVQGSAPTTNATEMGLYTKIGVTTNAEMFIRRESNGSEIEFTARGNTGNNYYSMLPSGLLIKFGSVGINTGGGSPSVGTITYDATIPFSAVYSVQLTVVGNPTPLTSATTANLTGLVTQAIALSWSGSVTNPVTVAYYTIGLP